MGCSINCMIYTLLKPYILYNRIGTITSRNLADMLILKLTFKKKSWVRHNCRSLAVSN